MKFDITNGNWNSFNANKPIFMNHNKLQINELIKNEFYVKLSVYTERIIE